MKGKFKERAILNYILSGMIYLSGYSGAQTLEIKPALEKNIPLAEVMRGIDDEIRNVLKDKKGEVLSFYQSSGMSEDDGICLELYSAFKAKGKVKFINPLLISSSSEQKEIVDFLKTRKEKPFEYFSDSESISYKAVGDVAIYQVDIDNDSSNGNEIVYYGEQYVVPELDTTWFNHGDQYAIYSSDGKLSHNYNLEVFRYSVEKKKEFNISGVIYYKGVVYSYFFYMVDGKPYRRISFSGLFHRSNYNELMMCNLKFK